ncbi:MAG: hypothetical protein A4S09_07565 [Proteobacteria bacterium SG_bin7]|nr:MAG: hypothetical protein A4S09_07565 [Proteobacteria bacterium SG_bin7]
MKLSNLLESLEGIELSTNAVIAALVALCIVTVLMLREFFTWMVKTKRVRQDINNIAFQLNRIEEKIDSLRIQSVNTEVTKVTGPYFNFPLEMKPEPKIVDPTDIL